MRDSIQFVFRDQVVRLNSVKPTDMALGWLREQRLATGTKEGCNEGDCGACTVILARLDPATGTLEYSAVNACILLLAQLDGRWLLTVEDLAAGQELDPLQTAMVENNATQCGFCTPGFVMMTLAGQLSGSHLSAEALLAGNLCRCTGYGGLLATARTALDAGKPQAWTAREDRVLPLLKSLPAGGFRIDGAGARIDAPGTLSALLELKQANPDALIIAGATDVGLWMTKHLHDPKHIILTRSIDGFQDVTVDDGAIHIGAGASYAQAGAALLADYPEATAWFERLGSCQVRAAGTIGGNIANGSPIGDSPPLFIALGATLCLQSSAGSRTIALEDFFLEYGKQDLAPGEVVVSVTVPRRSKNQRLVAEKVSKRIDQDISSVMAVFSDRDGEHRYAFGGMAGVPALAHQAMASRSAAALEQDFAPMDDHRASAWYRMQVSKNLLNAFLEDA